MNSINNKGFFKTCLYRDNYLFGFKSIESKDFRDFMIILAFVISFLEMEAHSCKRCLETASLRRDLACVY